MILFAQIELKDHGVSALSHFEAELQSIPQIVEASHVSGSFDYIVKAVVKNMEEWTRIGETLTNAGAERLFTHVLMGKPKIFVGYPIRY